MYLLLLIGIYAVVCKYAFVTINELGVLLLIEKIELILGIVFSIILFSKFGVCPKVILFLLNFYYSNYFIIIEFMDGIGDLNWKIFLLLFKVDIIFDEVKLMLVEE